MYNIGAETCLFYLLCKIYYLTSYLYIAKYITVYIDVWKVANAVYFVGLVTNSSEHTNLFRTLLQSGCR